eukprot:CAMPEP_0170331770 /NCGR_PEP_ID=MMETSP0116_2-20130129/66871_1 /TAXON_ID=400756 /ORGANISM="Durinskia baltica, Strain CSIRO CS-38" /LENGTH=316 /DNA_ID=CAMNT_0010585045 /DNA_START=14 /DNA_END=959 /DNA_ORIENTATION=+
MAELSEQIVNFCLNWNLDDRSQAALVALSPEVAQQVISTFNPGGVLDINEKFMQLVASVDPASGASVGGGAATMSQASMLPQSGDFEDRLRAFQQQWNVNEDALNKIRQLAPEVQKIVIEQFNPRDVIIGPEMPDLSGKLIMFACSIDKRQNGGGGKGSAFGKAGCKGGCKGTCKGGKGKDPWGAGPTWGGWWDAWGGDWGEWGRSGMGKGGGAGGGCCGYGGDGKSQGKMLGKACGKGPGKTSGKNGEGMPVSEAEIAEFCMRWNLGDDALQKLRKIPPALQRRAIQQFAPGELPEYNGKFIMFCASMEKALYRR